MSQNASEWEIKFGEDWIWPFYLIELSKTVGEKLIKIKNTNVTAFLEV